MADSATNDLLDVFKATISPESDYNVSKVLGVTRQRVSQWRNGHNGMGDERAIELCEAVWPGDDAKKIEWLARLAADRAGDNDRVRHVWESMIARVAAIAPVGLLTFPETVSDGIRYILCQVAPRSHESFSQRLTIAAA